MQIRRVVTGHDDNGRAVVTIDEVCKNVMSRRPKHESCVVWSTGSFPPTIPARRTAARTVATTDPNGTVFRIGMYHPGVAPRNHRTESVDYAIVMSGEIDMEIDGANVHLKAGDVLVQRGTIHNWTNPGTEPCIIAFVLVAVQAGGAGGQGSRRHRMGAVAPSASLPITRRRKRSKESSRWFEFLLLALLCALAKPSPGAIELSFAAGAHRRAVAAADGTDIIARVRALLQHHGPAVLRGEPAGRGQHDRDRERRARRADGYTLLFVPSTLALNSVMYKKVSYDPVRDFAPITLAAAANNVLINPAVAKTLLEFVALAKRRPGQLTYGARHRHLAAHVDGAVQEPRRRRPAAHSLSRHGSGHDRRHQRTDHRDVLQCAHCQAADRVGRDPRARRVWSQAQRGLARHSADRRGRRGLRGDAVVRAGGAGGTPPDIVARLHAEATQALKTQEMKDKLAGDGAEPVGTTPAEFAAHIKSELAKWANVARPPGRAAVSDQPAAAACSARSLRT